MQFPQIRTHSFRDKLFRILWRRYRRAKDEIVGSNQGYCDHRESPGATMYVYPSADDLELLGTIAHESVHACFSDLDNDAVGEWESDFVRLLKRMKIEVKFHGR